MMLTIMTILHDAFFSALAAMGLALLFNVPPKALLWCMGGGAVRTVLMGVGQ